MRRRRHKRVKGKVGERVEGKGGKIMERKEGRREGGDG